MPVTTRRTNASTHPGDIVRNAQQNRRTRQEIEEEKAKAKATSIAVRQEAARKQCAVISTIVALKSLVEHEEKAIREHAIRPDLRHPNATGKALPLGLPVRVRKATGTTHYSAG